MLADGSEYRGRYGRTVAQLRDFHRERLAVLAATDADVLAIETIPEVEEAAAVAGLLAETDGAAAWIRFTCADGARLRSGAPIEEAVAAVDGTPGVRRDRRQLHGARARPGARRADRRHHDPARSSSTRTAARAGTPPRRTWTGEAGRARRRARRHALGRRGRAARRRLLPGHPGPDRRPRDGLPANAAHGRSAAVDAGASIRR